MTLEDTNFIATDDPKRGRRYAVKGVCCLFIPVGVPGYDALDGATSAMVAVHAAYAAGGRSLASEVLRAAATCSAHDSVELHEAAFECLEAAGLL